MLRGSDGRRRDGADGTVLSYLVTGYLFVGGSAAGLLVVLSALSLAEARRVRAADPSVDVRRLWATGARFPHPAGAAHAGGLAVPRSYRLAAWIVCFGLFALASCLLAADLGRFDRVALLVVSPAPSAIAVGFYALACAAAIAGAQAALALRERTRMRPRLAFALGILGLAAGAVTAVYTGVLLSGMASVLAWQTPLVPLLFAVSSLSCGCAIAAALAALLDGERGTAPLVGGVLLIDRVLLLVEGALVAAFAAWLLAHDGTRTAAETLFAGDLAPWFWAGLAAVGIAAPLAAECTFRKRAPGVLIAASGCVLAGGALLRWLVVQLGQYDVAAEAFRLATPLLS